MARLVVGNLDFRGAAARVWQSFVPTQRAMAIIRATGHPRAPRDELAKVAAAVASDRLAPLRGFGGVCVSAYLTANADSERAPYVEFRGEYIGVNITVLAAIVSGNPSKLMNLSGDIATPAHGNFTPARPPSQGSRGNTAGSPAARLVAQLLTPGTDPCRLPAAPPAREAARDTAALA